MKRSRGDLNAKVIAMMLVGAVFCNNMVGAYGSAHKPPHSIEENNNIITQYSTGV